MTKRSITEEESTKLLTDGKEEAEEMKDSPSKIKEFLNRVVEKLKSIETRAKEGEDPVSEAIVSLFDNVKTLYRMIRAYVNKEYTDIPWDTIAIALGALIYFVNPWDLIPIPFS